MHCFEFYGRVQDAQVVALQVLEKLRSVKKRKGKILPQVGGDDKDLWLLVVEIVVNLVRARQQRPNRGLARRKRRNKNGKTSCSAIAVYHQSV